MTALEQARALGMMATLGAALGGIYDLMGMMRRVFYGRKDNSAAFLR